MRDSLKLAFRSVNTIYKYKMAFCKKSRNGSTSQQQFFQVSNQKNRLFMMFGNAKLSLGNLNVTKHLSHVSKHLTYTVWI